jgi:hypothetical protein
VGIGNVQPLQFVPSSGVCGMTGVSGCWTAQPLQPLPPSAKAGAVRATNAMAARTVSFMFPSTGSVVEGCNCNVPAVTNRANSQSAPRRLRRAIEEAKRKK